MLFASLRLTLFILRIALLKIQIRSLGCEYHIFAGRDATRLLARNKLEEETEEELKRPLSIADRAFLATWMYTFKNKYDIVGKLEGFDPEATKM